MTKEELINVESDVLEGIDPIIYYLDKMVYAFRENYFSCNEDLFDDDANAQRIFVASYQEMAAELFAISELMYNVRLQIDFATGQKTRAVEARLKDNAKFEHVFGTSQCSKEDQPA